MEGVRFCEISLDEIAELSRGHLKLIKFPQEIDLTFSEFHRFLESEIPKPYNVASNNCIHFAHHFYHLGLDKWSDYNGFAKHIEQHFVEVSEKQQNDCKQNRKRNRRNHLTRITTTFAIIYHVSKVERHMMRHSLNMQSL
eukprot:222836_1